jgi:hypothetical protein
MSVSNPSEGDTGPHQAVLMLRNYNLSSTVRLPYMGRYHILADTESTLDIVCNREFV